MDFNELVQYAMQETAQQAIMAKFRQGCTLGIPADAPTDVKKLVGITLMRFLAENPTESAVMATEPESGELVIHFLDRVCGCVLEEMLNAE